MRKLYILFVLFCSISLFADQPDFFGEVQFIENSGVKESMTIRQALLYRNVNIGYDSTIFVQSSDGNAILYYPQISKGRQNVLRLVLGKVADANRKKMDFYINLGDSIPETLQFTDQTDQLFIEPNGLATPQKFSARKINGSVQIIKGRGKKEVSGEFDLTFEKVNIPEATQTVNYHISGDFDVPVAKYREGSLSSSLHEKQKNKKYHTNSLIAVSIVAVIFAIFGFR